MPGTKKDWFDTLQERFMWMGIFTIFVYFILKFDFARDIFGNYIKIAGIVNASAGWLCFLFGGVKTIKMVSRVFRALENVKKGETDD